MIPAILQSSAILVIGLSAVGVLRRQSAAMRHTILTLALFSSIVVPLVSPLIPEPVPPPVVEHVVAGFSPRSVPITEETRAKARDYIGTESAAGPRFPFVYVLWMAGFATSITVMVVGMLRIASTVRQAKPFDGSRMLQHSNTARSVDILRNTRLVLGTWGVLRPCILLPADAETWSDDRLRVVLTHELAHIQRFDWPIQMIAELARAVYWFNPLFWFLCRRLRAESEHACDDAVLNSGINANDYAVHLLELARSFRNSHHTWSPVLAMARPPHLERRFIAMLNPSLKRKPASRVAILIACSAALTLTIFIGAIGAAAQTQPAVTVLLQTLPVPSMVSIAKVEEPPVAKVAAKRPAPKPAPAQGLADGSLAGSVTDPTGALVPRVTVTVSSRTTTQNAVTETDVQTTTSDQAGRYQFAALTPGQYSLKAELPGFATFRATVQIERGQTYTQNVSLSVGSIVQRVTVTGAGQPKGPAPAGVPRRLRIGGNVIAANLISQVKPVYPQSALDSGIEGTVHLQGLIGTDGTLIGLTPLNNVDRGLTSAALEAVRQWRYKPTLLNGEPVEVLTTIDVEFKLAQ